MRRWRSALSGFDKQGRGKRGERAAARHLRRHGYKVLVRNYRGRHGEIDLVCRHEGTLVFAEVKARGTRTWGSPAEAVTATKRRRIIHTAYSYLQELPTRDMPARFDVVEVFLDDEGRAERCQIIRDAFDLSTVGRGLGNK